MSSPTPTPKKRGGVHYSSIIPLIIAGVIVFALIWLVPLATIHNQPNAIGSSPNATSSAGSGAQSGGAAPVQKLLPIESVDVLALTSYPAQYVVNVEGYVPDSCAKALDPVVKHDGFNFTITIGMERPTGAVCAQIATPYKRSFRLGALPAGTYQVTVNGKAKTFQAQ